MKIRVTLVIDLNGKAWAEYQGLGRDASASEIREDVKGHVLNSMQNSPFLEEADAQVSLA